MTVEHQWTPGVEPLPFVHEKIPSYYWDKGLSVPCLRVEAIALDLDVAGQVRCARCDGVVFRTEDGR